MSVHKISKLSSLEGEGCRLDPEPPQERGRSTSSGQSRAKELRVMEVGIICGKCWNPASEKKGDGAVLEFGIKMWKRV